MYSLFSHSCTSSSELHTRPIGLKKLSLIQLISTISLKKINAEKCEGLLLTLFFDELLDHSDDPCDHSNVLLDHSNGWGGNLCNAQRKGILFWDSFPICRDRHDQRCFALKPLLETIY